MKKLNYDRLIIRVETLAKTDILTDSLTDPNEPVKNTTTDNRMTDFWSFLDKAGID